MNFFNDEIHEEMIALYRDFATGVCAPIAAEIDEEEKFPVESFKQAAEMGLMGIPFPEEYGGAGLDELSYAQCIEEVSKVCASTAVGISAHTSLCSWPIYKFGTEEQKAKYLPQLLSGEKLGAFGLTEPNAGTDAAGQKTVFEDKGDYYLVNGSKRLCRHLHRFRYDRQVPGQQGNHRSDHGKGNGRIQHRLPREEDGYPRIQHLRTRI